MEEKFINITDGALDFIRKAVAQENCLGIRVDVVPGGCQGTAYEISFVKEIDPSDLVMQEGGVDVYIASKAAIFVAGMNMDYVSGPMGGSIVFENPNAKSKCGCGKSFCFDDSGNSCGEGRCF
ncbi:MAG: iron-sulfur cluster assembly accessory protein [Holosporaceae bacterium]|jgi:iron-sulfur cluster assembly protein|nr:iron-sulfur cluster assembly accessory protein [Holosporaceae bacterium]